MSLKLTFEITFLSDYHVGAGYGKGFGLDSALLREADGSPVLRGSALAGLLRGSTYRLLELPQMQKHPRDETLQQLFGTPGQAKRWYVASAHPATFQARDAQRVQRVRIDPRTRRAEPRKLFSQEEGRAGQVFRFTITCPYNDESALDEAAFLVATARYTRQLGRSRRRGLGECVIHLTDVAGVAIEKPANQSWEDWFLERFNQKWLKGKPTAAPQTSPAWTDVEALQVFNGNPVRIRVIVRLDEPLLIAERAPAGNQFDARPFIPGGTVLGVLANLAAQRCDLTSPDEYRDFVALFRRDGVAFPALYPAYEYGNFIYPTIPSPLGLLTCSVVPFEGENEGHGTFVAGSLKECPECGSKLEPVGDFTLLRHKPPFTCTPGRSSELHIQVKEETQRVEKGQLYGYTVLNAGQYFVGELVCTESAWKRLREMTGIAEKTPLTWRLGKAQRRGYGKVTAWLERYDNKEPVWIQLPLSERVADGKERISLTLLTDTIIADRWGRQATGFSEKWLKSVLGLGPLEIADAYSRIRVVDSFNATLGLPRWRDTALIAGSVVWFTLLNPPDDWQERMEQLEREGIGLRRNEGYGRIAFNHPVYERRGEFTESAIRLEEAMRQKNQPRKAFVKLWEEKLEEFLPSNKRLAPRFVALARWLHSHHNQTPAEILNSFKARFEGDKCQSVDLQEVFGEPDNALIEAIGGRAEYGARSKDNFFADEGKDAMLKICNALKYLENEDQHHWSEGIEILSDRIVALARSEKGETE
ncbi:hypothetical protein D6833_00125 [Candidatus Parcubacteria bacterium]|nr:MAG: hypothetical protein D6833_00125 [Candidatus Parcubacteria bacterium]